VKVNPIPLSATLCLGDFIIAQLYLHLVFDETKKKNDANFETFDGVFSDDLVNLLVHFV
jgi:hypothetical protein